MKNIKIYFLFSFLLVSLNSCDEELTILPNNALIAETAFQSFADLQLGLNRVYGNLDPYTNIRFNSVFTDETKIGADSGGQEFALHSLVLNSNTGVANTLWVRRYTAINNANRVLAASENIEGDQSAKDHIRAQCFAIRALSHFELFQYFTPDYTDPNGMSVPAVDFVVTTENLPRNNVSEVMQLIQSDISSAEQLLDQNSNDINFVSLDMITALKARVALYTRDFGSAANFAQSLLSKYPIATKDQYTQMFFNDSGTPEIIFQKGVTPEDARAGSVWVFTNSGGPFLEASDSISDGPSDDDIRSEVIISQPRLTQERVQVVNKYPGVSIPYLNDFKVFRSSEMLLIAAEALVENGDLAGGEALLNQLRTARINDQAIVSFSDRSQAIDLILEERRLELAFEGHRYLDLKRLGRDLKRSNSDCSDLANACTLEASDHRFTVPIPIDELAANDLLTQNPGY